VILSFVSFFAILRIREIEDDSEELRKCQRYSSGEMIMLREARYSCTERVFFLETPDD
jgi:hypothetical protein